MGGAPATGDSGSLGVREKPQGECAGCGEGGREAPEKRASKGGAEERVAGLEIPGDLEAEIPLRPPHPACHPIAVVGRGTSFRGSSAGWAHFPSVVARLQQSVVSPVSLRSWPPGPDSRTFSPAQSLFPLCVVPWLPSALALASHPQFLQLALPPHRRARLPAGPWGSGGVEGVGQCPPDPSLLPGPLSFWSG